MRASFLLIPLLSATAVFAQAPLEREPAGEPRKNQKIERIQHEDASNRIEEVRVGGQMQSIKVQPKAGVPSYEIQPTDLARSRPSESREGFSERKPRVWNVLGF
jgi:hypothetical protein